MKAWFALLAMACAEKPQLPCIDGTHRDDGGRCVPDDAEPSGDGDTGRATDDDTGVVSEDDTGTEPEDTAPPPWFPPTPAWMSLADASVVFEGGAEGARVGRAVAGAGDVDRDGLADILIGADRADGVGGGSYGGRVTLHLADAIPATGRIDIGTHHTQWMGVSEDELLGHTLGAGGDIDGDGHMDLLIAGYHAPAGGHFRGKVYGVSGATLESGTHSIATADWTISGTRDVEGLGHGMSTAGDVDGDGRSDLVMGACCGFPPGLGRAWVVTGAALTGGSIDLDSHTPRWEGEDVDDQAGYKTSPAGDVDGDGLDDVAIGARLQSAGANRAGKVYILLGASMEDVSVGSLSDADVHLPSTQTGAEQGYDIGPVGDLDGDGLDEVIVGAYHSNRYAMVAGEVMLYFGSALSTRTQILDTEADLRFLSTEVNHLLGVSVEGDMDLDGNGSADLVIGASGMAPPTQGEGGEDETEGMDSPGNVYLYWGEALSPGVHDVAEAPVHFEGEELNDHVGIRVTSPGDVDGDGSDDLLIGTERGQNGIGLAYLLMGLRSG